LDYLIFSKEGNQNIYYHYQEWRTR